VHVEDRDSAASSFPRRTVSLRRGLAVAAAAALAIGVSPASAQQNPPIICPHCGEPTQEPAYEPRWVGELHNLSNGRFDIVIKFLRVFSKLGPAPDPGNYARADPQDGALSPITMVSTGRCPGARAAVVTPGARFLYVANGDVCAFALDWSAGTATPVPGMPFHGGTFARSIAIDRSGAYVYTPNQDSNDVAAFAVDAATGVLTPVPGSPFAAGAEPFAAAVDGSGRFLYVANHSGNSVSGYRIDIATGALAPVPGSPFAAPAAPWAMAADPKGRYLYVAGDALQPYRIDPATGTLSPTAPAVATFGKGVAVDPTGRFVYLAVGIGGVDAFAIGPTGALTPAGARVPTGDNPLGIVVDSTGTAVYAANLLSASTSAFSVHSQTGALTPIAGSPFPTGESPYGLLAHGALPRQVSWTAGERFAFPVVVRAGVPPYTFAIADGSLPPGLALDGYTGMVTGTPVSAGLFSYTVRVTDAAGSAGTAPYTFEVTAGAAGGIAQAVEFYHATLDHYFVTWIPDEIAKLDAGVVLKGWVRTGKSFNVYTAAGTDTSPVCRFYIPPDKGDSHFYGRGVAECNATQAKYPTFTNEDSQFFHVVLPAAGACPAGTVGVYRVFSNRADANHRYTIEQATRDAMVAKGWLAEGDGPDRVVMCVPA